MSIENLRKFGQLVAEDATVREEVKAIGKTNVEGMMTYAAQRGLPFDEDDMRAAAKEAGFGHEELNEEQLKTVAGGAITLTALGVACLVAGGAAGGAMGAAAVSADDW
jgi:predicted ribosomally synthesized peptide with nif11-like leader